MASAQVAYKAKLSASGTSTAMTAQACAQVGVTKTWQISNSSKRVLDPSVARTWKDGGSAIAAANIQSEDLLFGTVTFISSFTPGGAVTVDANYLPITALASVKSMTLEQTVDMPDATLLNSSGYKARIPTLTDAKGDLQMLSDFQDDIDPSGTTTTLYGLLTSRTPLLLELDEKGTGVEVFRAWVLIGDEKVAFDPKDLTQGSLSWQATDRGSPVIAAASGWGAP